MSDDQPLILASAIDSLRELGGDEFLQEIIGIFTEDTPQRLQELSTAFAAGDADTFVRAAHSIKGSSSNLGAERLRVLAESLEHDAKNSGLAGLDQRLPALTASFEATVAELKKL